ncbi:MAG TPA: hypothetical protein PK926_14400 [Spirochaetota bacterium]|nr:hypothetical protein [Spirochaetota bacterium]HPI91186.1 hypothetical protein [Spirochaetota bacterium]HPR49474.1 hypothetical protein [Spirochaetota bacterium]
MEITYKLENGPELIFKSSVLSGNINLFINNNKQKKAKEKGKPWKITAHDGSQKKISIRNNFFFYLEPIILIDGNEVLIDRKLLLWEIIFSALPLLLIFIGGFIGALLGLMAFFININIFRNNKPVIMKIIYSILSTGLAAFLYLVFAVIINSLAM